jgi:hypothetical protein
LVRCESLSDEFSQLVVDASIRIATDDAIHAQSREFDGMSQVRSDRVTALVPVLMLASFSLFWFSYTVADPDLWGHIRFGLDILRSGAVAQHDIYSYRTGSQPWINHEWLSEVIFARLYDVAGPAGLIAFKLVVSASIVGLCYWHLRRCDLSPVRSALLLILISVPFRMGLGTVRPQFFTYLATLVLLLLLQTATTERNRRLWALPLLFALWVNLHGGVLAGAGILGIWIMAKGANQLLADRGPWGPNLGGFVQLVLVAIACALALLLNPYGARLLIFLLRTATVPRPEISEWLPLELTSFPGLICLVLAAIGIIGFAFSRRRRTPESIVTLFATLLLTFMSNRHYPLFALTLIVAGGEHVADVWNRLVPALGAQTAASRGLTTASLAVAVLWLVLSFSRLSCIPINAQYFPFPARVVALLKQSGFRGNLAVPFTWGEYALWHLGPGVKVSIDGRRETVYSDAIYRETLDFEQGTGAWDSLLKSSATDLVLTHIGSPTANLMSRTDGWLPLYNDTFCVLFIRARHPSFDRIVAIPVPGLPDNGDRLCFPAPGPRQKIVPLQAP